MMRRLGATRVALLAVGLGAVLGSVSEAGAAKTLKVRSDPVRGSLALDATSSDAMFPRP